MQIDRTLADAYFSGTPAEAFRDAWFFTASSVAGQMGKNIFTPPPSGAETMRKARTAERGIEAGARDFVPLNLPVWDALCPDWRRRLADVWEHAGISGLKSSFQAGWNGFAAKTIGADRAR